MTKKTFDFIGKRKIFLFISVAILVAGLIVNIFMGTELDINFKGGAIFTYSLTGEVDKEGITAIAKDHLGEDVEVSFSTDMAGASTQATFTLVKIPSTVLTYSVTGTPDLKVLADKGQEVFGCETRVSQDTAAKTVAVDPVNVVTDSMVDQYTAAIASTEKGAPTYAFVSANTVSDLADAMLDEMVTKYGTVLQFKTAADVTLAASASESETDAKEDKTLTASDFTTTIEGALIQLVGQDGDTDVNVTVDDTAKTVKVVPANTGRVFAETETKAITEALQAEFDKAGISLSAETNNGVELVTSNSVKPTVGKGFFIKCLFAMVLGGVFLTLYIGIRFRKIGGLSAGLFATMALIHDILIAYMAYVVFRIPLDDNFIAVVLTILGYSVNGTIVVYDRIRENEQKLGTTLTINEIVNRSVNETVTRNIFTSLTTLITVVAIAVVAKINGLDSIISFAFPMAIGIVSGFYSSVLLSSPLWAWWRTRKLGQTESK